MGDRTTIEFDDSMDEGTRKAYQDRIRRAQGGNVPLGGAPPIQGFPLLTEAQEQAQDLRETLPEEDRSYGEKELRDLIQAGQAVPGIGAGHPANQEGGHDEQGPRVFDAQFGMLMIAMTARLKGINVRLELE